MNKRSRVRYHSDLLPDSISNVTVSWNENSPVEAVVANCCAHGMKVLIPSSKALFEIPSKSDIVTVQIQKDKKPFAGMCVSASAEQDGSVHMGIYFYNPDEQNYLQTLLYKSLNENHLPNSFVSYEWEETVDKLCSSDDPHLKEIGLKAKDMLKIRHKLSNVYSMV
jgi:hypothetical protein